MFPTVTVVSKYFKYLFEPGQCLAKLNFVFVFHFICEVFLNIISCVYIYLFLFFSFRNGYEIHKIDIFIRILVKSLIYLIFLSHFTEFYDAENLVTVKIAFQVLPLKKTRWRLKRLWCNIRYVGICKWSSVLALVVLCCCFFLLLFFILWGSDGTQIQ